MTRPLYTTVNSGLEGWDSDVNDNLTVLKGPLPVKQSVDMSVLAALAASSYDQCLVAVREGSLGLLMMSDATVWRSVGGMLPDALIYIDAGSTAQAIVAATDELVTGFSADGADGNARGLTADKTNDKLVIPAPWEGRYVIGFSVSIVASDANIVLEFSVRVGGARDATLVAQGTCGDVTNKINVAMSGVVDVASPAVDVELWVKGSLTGNITIEHAQLFARALEIRT